MRLVDTNMLVDLVREPGSRDTAWLSSVAAEAGDGQPLVVIESVFVECMWALQSALRFSPAEADRIMSDILAAEGIEPWDAALAAYALDVHAGDPRLGIVDCLLVAHSWMDGADVVTADRLLNRTLAAGPAERSAAFGALLD